MAEHYFTADMHFGHKNIIDYCKRPFETVEQMTEEMIDNHNRIVKPGDTTHIMGDFAFLKPAEAARVLSRMNGQKYLIIGNHDKRLIKNDSFMSELTWARDYSTMKVGGQKIVMSHYPMLSWDDKQNGAWMLHGHCHGTLYHEDPQRVDVGVDSWGYAPVHFEELDCYISTMVIRHEFTATDHHMDGSAS